MEWMTSGRGLLFNFYKINIEINVDWLTIFKDTKISFYVFTKNFFITIKSLSCKYKNCL